jgi:hypothetical protein
MLTIGTPKSAHERKERYFVQYNKKYFTTILVTKK